MASKTAVRLVTTVPVLQRCGQDQPQALANIEPMYSINCFVLLLRPKRFNVFTNIP